jgi:Xaa-Pro aminopeptidase
MSEHDTPTTRQDIASLEKQKVGQAAEILTEFSLDAWLTFVRETSVTGDPALEVILGKDVTWASAFLVSAGDRADSTAIVGSLDASAVRDVGAFDEVVEYVESIKPDLLAWLERVDPKHIAINYSEDSEIADGLSHGMFLRLSNYLKGTRFADRLCSSERLVAALRERKTATEIVLMKEAIRHTLEIYDEVHRFLKPGQSEIEVARFMSARAAERGLEMAWAAEHCPSVFTGPDTAGAHYGPTDRRIERGHILNMDFGVRYKGYCSDLQRTFYVLREGEDAGSIPGAVQHGFDTLLTSIQRAFDAIRPGALGKEIDAIARGVIVDAGYDEYPHALGHQVGRHAHDGAGLLAPPWERYGKRSILPIEIGQVYTIEPRLMVPGHGVVTMEEEILVGADGAEWLSKPQKELLLV